ncbi:hypothetical protein B0H10DRAFT_2212436 [Mycena sp. CBHHK59/15]|nr:hypothetical protein B0H10DRAFT_2212436 [Mycena sp. CBHHK59/15]
MSAAVNQAIVDERDPLVSYAGVWNNAGSSAEFNGTTRWSGTQGATATFTFVGTSITVYGTVAAINPPLASLGFAIDGAASGTYTPANLTSDVHHEALWTSPTLSSGSAHTLYLMYSTTSTAVRTYFVDDRDPRIMYSPPWQPLGSDEDFQHTSQASSNAGDSFSQLHIILGGINNDSVGNVLNASITIDGGLPVFYVPPIQTAAVTTNNLIFQSNGLSNGSHTLVVTAENGHAVGIDYLLVGPVASSSSPSSLLTGAIIGVAAGGLALLALKAELVGLVQTARDSDGASDERFSSNPIAVIPDTLGDIISWVRKCTLLSVYLQPLNPDLLFVLKLTDGSFVHVILHAAAINSVLEGTKLKKTITRLDLKNMFFNEDGAPVSPERNAFVQNFLKPKTSARSNETHVLRVIASFPVLFTEPKDGGRMYLQNRNGELEDQSTGKYMRE